MFVTLPSNFVWSPYFSILYFFSTPLLNFAFSSPLFHFEYSSRMCPTVPLSGSSSLLQLTRSQCAQLGEKKAGKVGGASFLHISPPTRMLQIFLVRDCQANTYECALPKPIKLMKVKVDDSFNNGKSESQANGYIPPAPADEGWLVYTNTDGDWTQQALGDELPCLLIMLRRLTEANQR